MKILLPLLIGATAFIDGAFAHYRWTSLIVNGTTTPQYYYVRANTNQNSPITDVTSTDMRCNQGGLTSGATTNTATVTAGSTAGFALDTAIIHPGPISVYLSKATGSVNSYDGSGSWFKISELGAVITSTAITFAAVGLTSYSFKIPASTPSGQYLLRIEQMGLHNAGTVGGAQFYISCAQINIVSGGSGSPQPLVSIPGYIKATDPGVLIGIYWPVPTSYTIPGPAVWSG